MSDLNPMQQANASTDRAGPDSLSGGGIPELGASSQRKLNMKVFAFIGVIALMILALFYYMIVGGRNAKAPPKAKEQSLSIPQPPALAKQAEPVPTPVGETTAAATAQNQDQALRLRRMGGAPKPGGAEPPKEIPPLVGPTPAYVVTSYAAPAALGLGSPSPDLTGQNIVRRRAQESGGVATVLGGQMLNASEARGAAGTSNTPPANSSTPLAALNSPMPNTSLPPGLRGLSEGGRGPGQTGTSNGGLGKPNNNPIGAPSFISGLPKQGAEAGGGGGGGGGESVMEQGTATAFPVNQARSVPIDPSTYIPQGTAVRCVLQTLIMTDMPGPTACTVVEDIRSFDAQRVLIPKGSRVMGEYKPADASLDRVAIVWTRLITPQNIDISINSPGISPLGTVGVQGNVDYRWGERISGALMISLASDALKYAIQTRGPTIETVTYNALGQPIVTSLPFQSNTIRNAERFVDQDVTRALRVPPRIEILQGTVVSILTAQDMSFAQVLSGR